MANVLHAVFIVIAWLIILRYLKTSTSSKFRVSLRLLQILPILFALDFLVGFTLVEHYFGAHASAGWISKSAYIFPVLFFIALWQMFRNRKNESR